MIVQYSSVDGDSRQLTPSFLLYMTFHRMLHTGSSLPALAGSPSSRCLLRPSLIAYFATSCRPQYFASRLALSSALYPSRSPSFRYACRITGTTYSQPRLETVMGFRSGIGHEKDVCSRGWSITNTNTRVIPRTGKYDLMRLDFEDVTMIEVR
jgi:hypothetical protein